jgi:hypothetical protein
MDEHPWTYELSNEELLREHAILTDPDSLLVGNCRQYAIGDYDISEHGATVCSSRSSWPPLALPPLDLPLTMRRCVAPASLPSCPQLHPRPGVEGGRSPSSRDAEGSTTPSTPGGGCGTLPMSRDPKLSPKHLFDTLTH